VAASSPRQSPRQKGWPAGGSAEPRLGEPPYTRLGEPPAPPGGDDTSEEPLKAPVRPRRRGEDVNAPRLSQKVAGMAPHSGSDGAIRAWDGRKL
jgi:hypothetical protein